MQQMADSGKPSLEKVWAERASAINARHEQRAIDIGGNETIQKQVIYNTLPAMLRAGGEAALEVAQYVALGVPLVTQDGKELAEAIGYDRFTKGSAYGGELQKIMNCSLMADIGGLKFDPSEILSKLTHFERSMMFTGEKNIQVFMKKVGEEAAQEAVARRMSEEYLNPPPYQRPSLPFTPAPRFSGADLTPELKREYEKLGISEESKQKALLDDALKGKPPKPLFYYWPQPLGNGHKSDERASPKEGGEPPSSSLQKPQP
jgi:hypothetical protein